MEDSQLAEKLGKKAKDPSSRKFMNSLLLPRRLKTGRSIFYLDFFHVGSWSYTSEIPPEKIKGVLIIKNTSSRPMTELMDEDEEAEPDIHANLPENYWLSSLMDVAPKTITIAFGEPLDGTEQLRFPFIKEDTETSLSGVTISQDVDLDKLD